MQNHEQGLNKKMVQVTNFKTVIFYVTSIRQRTKKRSGISALFTDAAHKNLLLTED
jgi:hypothetical protein